MIDVIVSSHCTHCATQREIMERHFFDDEFRIIDAGSKDFANYEFADKIMHVPCVVIRDKEGSIMYAGIGVHQEEKLRKLASDAGSTKEGQVFNLRQSRLDQP